MAAETTQAQCHAITEDGERCERPAGADGFCYQHDESDDTVDEYEETASVDGDDNLSSDGGTAAEETGESREAEETSEESSSESDESSGESEETSSESEDSSSEPADSGGSGGLDGVRDVRETVQTLAPEIIGRELDAVIEVDGTDDGWQAVVEVVERHSVPDTQDILGRYEIDLSGGSVTGYRRVDRYRRSDTDASQPR